VIGADETNFSHRWPMWILSPQKNQSQEIFRPSDKPLRALIKQFLPPEHAFAINTFFGALSIFQAAAAPTAVWQKIVFSDKIAIAPSLSIAQSRPRSPIALHSNKNRHYSKPHLPHQLIYCGNANTLLSRRTAVHQARELSHLCKFACDRARERRVLIFDGSSEQMRIRDVGLNYKRIPRTRFAFA